MSKKYRLLLSLLLLIIIPKTANAIESCDDEEIIINDHTECDVYFYQAAHELASYQYILEEPMTFTNENAEYKILAADFIVRSDKYIEMHLHVDMGDDGEPKELIHATQEELDATLTDKTPMARLDNFNAHRDETVHDKTTLIFELRDYEIPVKLTYSDEKIELGTIDFHEGLQFNDESTNDVSPPEGEDVIETRNVYIDIEDITREEDTILLEYSATIKKTNLMEKHINNIMIQIKQETAPDEFITLAAAEDSEHQEALDKETRMVGLIVGDKTKLTKDVVLHDDTSPIILEIIDIPSNEAMYTEDLTNLIE